jgi:hypothetical protein
MQADPPADGREQGRRSDARQQGDGIVPPEQLGPGHGGEHAGRDPDLQPGLARRHVPEPESPEQEVGERSWVIRTRSSSCAAAQTSLST